MPAYNAAKTLQKTYDEVMEQGIVDLVILVDDASQDETSAIACSLPDTKVYVHERNKGYGGNQKTCYRMALEAGADIVIMVHPDYQYTPKLIPAMAAMIGNGLYHCVLGSRILGGYALKGGMPVWKYIANRFLTLVENILHGRQAFRISYRIPGLFPGAAGTSLPGRQFRRLSLRQPDAGADHLAGIHDRRGELPRRNILRKPLRSISGAASAMALAVSGTALTFRLARMGIIRSRLFPVNQ